MSSPRLIAKSVNYQPNYLKCTIDVVGGRGWSTPPQATETVPSFQLMAQAPDSPHWRKEHSIHSCLWIVIHCMQHGLSVSSRIPSQAHAAHSASFPILGRVSKKVRIYIVAFAVWKHLRFGNTSECFTT